jgi:hypothetical protein
MSEARSSADHQPVVLCASTPAKRLRIASLLRDHGGFRIVGVCDNEAASARLVVRLGPSIVIGDDHVRSSDPSTRRRLELLLVNDLADGSVAASARRASRA